MELKRQRRRGRRARRQCYLRGECLFLGDKSLDLKCKPMVLRLVRHLLGAKATTLSKGELIRRLYIPKHRRNECPSPRLQASHAMNLSKLLSRARRLAREAFAGEIVFGGGVEWFPYNRLNRSYDLYRWSPEDACS